MTTTPDPIKIRESLDALERELKTALDKNRVAFDQLGSLGPYGGAAEPYNDEAFRLWKAALADSPDDPVILHHLAIMHHARAIDLEQGEHPDRSNPDWIEAMRYWERLWQMESFWNHLTGATLTPVPPEILDKLRQRLPTLALGIHEAIAFAFDGEMKQFTTKPHRAAFHKDRLQQSRFPQEHKEELRRGTYAEYIKSLPPTSWSANEPKGMEEALERLRLFLERDQHCLAAMEDALRMHARYLHLHIVEVNAAEDRARQRVLRAMRNSIAQWKDLFANCESYIHDHVTVRDRWAAWLKIAGQVEGALDQHESALHFQRRALKACANQGVEAKSCREALSHTILNLSIAQVNRALERKFDSKEQALNFFNGQIRAVQEAQALDPESERPSECLQRLKQFIDQINAGHS